MTEVIHSNHVELFCSQGSPPLTLKNLRNSLRNTVGLPVNAHAKNMSGVKR